MVYVEIGEGNGLLIYSIYVEGALVASRACMRGPIAFLERI